MSLKTSGGSKSNVLLTELVIVILFFALTAATAMQLFVGSYLKSRHNALVQEASVICQNWVEQLRGVENVEGFLLQNGFIQMGDGFFMFSHDEDTFVRAEVGEEPMGGGVLHYCKMNVGDSREGSEPLSALSIATYVPSEEVTS